SGVKPVRANRQSHFKSALTLVERSISAQTRAFLKIQDGCDGFCAYCLIPYARGASRSVPMDEVVAEATRLTESGVREIVLTGIHIGDYGKETLTSRAGPSPIVGLVDRLLDLPGLARLRISSLEPAEVSEELLDVLAARADKVCDHFHLPLQSGSDGVLKRMRRRYDAAGYRDAVERIRRRFPEANLGADVIPGFPGETEEEFQE